MSELNDSSFIETALKHHSTTQAAIKSLQHQLDCFDQIRNSTKEIFLLTEKSEEAVEKSTSSLLYSTSQYLFDSPERNSSGYPYLSSTLTKNVQDDSAVRNLLPNFENLQESGIVQLPSKSVPCSPIKALNSSQQSFLTTITKDSFASTSLPSTPCSARGAAFEQINGSVEKKNSMSSSYKNLSLVAPTSGCMNLSEVLARLTYSSMLNGTASGNGSCDSTSDELIGLLEKISRTGEQLKIDLQEARLRESSLLREVERLRSAQNGFNGARPNSASESLYSDLQRKCEKLEDAMLSLQNENVKLNRLLKESRGLTHSSSQVALLEEQLRHTEKENQRLKEKLSQINEQIEKLDRDAQRKETASIDVGAMVNFDKSEGTQLKVQSLEGDIDSYRTECEKNKNLLLRIDDLHRILLEKDSQIKDYKETLLKANDESRLSLSRCEDLEKKDVYKRKEVLELCDRFEKLKKMCKKMDAELQTHKDKEREESTRHWAFENSLQKAAQQNTALRSTLNTELEKLTMDKLLLQKDYDALKKRYDDLLHRIGNSSDLPKALPPTGLERVSQERRVSFVPEHDTGMIASWSQSSKAENKKNHSAVRNCRSAASGCPSTSRSLSRHKRRHTVPHFASRDQQVETNKKTVLSSTPKKCTYAEDVNARSDMVEGVPFEADDRRSLRTTPPRPMSSRARSSPVGRVDSYPPRASSLSPRSMRSFSKNAYTEEYLKNMNGASQSSVDTSSPTKFDISGLTTGTAASLNRSGGTSLSRSGPYDPPKERRLRALSERRRDVLASSFLAYGESPYSQEYLRNMDGVRLVANLSSNSDETTKPGLPRRSPEKGILKSGTSVPRDKPPPSDQKLLSSSLSKSSASVGSGDLQSTQDKSRMSSAVTSLKDAARSSDERRSSSASERSLHLSDLPQDPTDIYDKFRNFDSHMSAMPINDDRKLSQKSTALYRKDHSAPNEGRFVSLTREKPPPTATRKTLSVAKTTRADYEKSKQRKDCDSESVDQSSTSTLRDHDGRVEFLRELQTNTGVRMPALMRDVTMNSDVIVGENDVPAGDIRLGLSGKQEEYADKLVQKYTKKGRAFLKRLDRS